MARKLAAKAKNSLALDLHAGADKATQALSGASEHQSPDVDLRGSAEAAMHTMSVSGDTIALLTVLHRDRRFAMEQRKRSDLAIGAYLRSALGWRKDLPDAERKVIGLKAAAIAKKPEGTKWEQMILAQAESRKPFEAVEEDALKEMVAIAKQMPVWSHFGESVRGFGAASLAVIIAETGDLTNYSSVAKVWKRMGLAVMGDVRQGGLPKGSGAEAWIAHGYSPNRRSLAWNIGDTMLKAQVRKVKDDAGEDTGERYALGPYGQAYLDRKAYELAREPDMQPIKAHRRAQRYLEKRLLKHLWQAWRGADTYTAEKPLVTMPHDEIRNAA